MIACHGGEGAYSTSCQFKVSQSHHLHTSCVIRLQKKIKIQQDFGHCLSRQTLGFQSQADDCFWFHSLSSLLPFVLNASCRVLNNDLEHV